MPDRDIFTRHVEKDWRGPARRVLHGCLTDWDIGTVLKALRNDVKRQGCPQLNDIAVLVSQPLEIATDESNLDIQLLDIAMSGNHRNTALAIRGARRLITLKSSHSVQRLRHGGSTTERVREQVAEEFLVEVVRSKAMGYRLLQERSQNYGVSHEDQIASADASIEQIRNDPRFQKMVMELARDASGEFISQPANVKPEIDQDTLLEISVGVE